MSKALPLTKWLRYVAGNTKRLRLKRGWTQEALAAEAGLEARYVQEIERAKTNMTLAVLLDLATALGVHPRVLLNEAVGVKGIIESVTTIGYAELKKNGVFIVPGLVRMVVVKKPATKERKGINAFTKEPTVFKAKPARKVIKGRPVKAAKDAVA